MTAATSAFAGIYHEALKGARALGGRPIAVFLGEDMVPLWREYVADVAMRQSASHQINATAAENIYQARLALGRDGFLPLLSMRKGGRGIAVQTKHL